MVSRAGAINECTDSIVELAGQPLSKSKFRQAVHDAVSLMAHALLDPGDDDDSKAPLDICIPESPPLPPRRLLAPPPPPEPLSPILSISPSSPPTLTLDTLEELAGGARSPSPLLSPLLLPPPLTPSPPPSIPQSSPLLPPRPPPPPFVPPWPRIRHAGVRTTHAPIFNQMRHRQRGVSLNGGDRAPPASSSPSPPPLPRPLRCAPPSSRITWLRKRRRDIAAAAAAAAASTPDHDYDEDPPPASLPHLEVYVPPPPLPPLPSPSSLPMRPFVLPRRSLGHVLGY